MISAGELTERITIETATQTQNDAGEATLTWSTWKEVWANVQSMPGRSVEKYFDVVGVVALIAYQVRIRAIPDINTSMRVIYRGRTLEIGSISEYERVWYQDLFCIETKQVSA